MNYFTDQDLDSLVFFQVPKVLVLGERYKKMKPNALKLYMVLFDRMKLSMSNGWKDKDGRYYVRMSQDGAAKIFEWSPTTFRNMKKELEKFGLLDQVQEGQGNTNRLYIGKCEYDKEDIYKVNQSVDTEMKTPKKEAETFDMTEENKSCSSRKTKVDPLEEQKLTTSNNNYKENNSIKNKKEHIVNKGTVNNNQVTIDILVLEYMKKGLSKNVCLRVVEEIKKSEATIHNFGGYLRSALDKALYRSNYKKGTYDPHKYVAEERKNLYHDWLNEEEYH
ncbi:replication initiator protein A [Halobacillus sp. Marseille-Q1614]|uniref:replication initiator protein A n=2 Tax=Bacteria TaxID=2 RepID=UPI00157038B2|nr:replication initiator protein A [Halobacillus sp. Marseille-Q1614]